MPTVLPELQERDARGELAAIYAEIRRLWGVPYVSSLQRHLATRPGWLEWTWAVLGPVNLVFAGLLRRMLAGERPAGATAPVSSWSAPPAPGPLPRLVVADDLSPEGRAVLGSLGTTVGAQPFVPGLYRMLAGWPGFLAHVATVLRPHLHDAATVAACARVLAAVDAEIPGVFATLPALPADTPRPSADEAAGVLVALDTYRETSPQMVVFGRMLRDALPGRQSP